MSNIAWSKFPESKPEIGVKYLIEYPYKAGDEVYRHKIVATFDEVNDDACNVLVYGNVWGQYKDFKFVEYSKIDSLLSNG